MRMKSVFAVLVGVLILFTWLCAFTGLEYEDDLVGDYAVWAVDAIEQAAIVEKRGGGLGIDVVGSMVFAYGWNDDFIIAKQHPLYPNENHKIDTGTTHWYIVEVGTGKVHGPLTEDEFRQLRIELKMPSDVLFTKTVQL